MAIHEPVVADHSPPTVYEADLLKTRLESSSFLKRLEERINEGDFGMVDPLVGKALERAKQWIIEIIDDNKFFLKESEVRDLQEDDMLNQAPLIHSEKGK
jgi:hypothetical protein